MELNRESILSEIAERFSTDVSSITDETKFKEDLKADSIDLYQMVVEYAPLFYFLTFHQFASHMSSPLLLFCSYATALNSSTITNSFFHFLFVHSL